MAGATEFRQVSSRKRLYADLGAIRVVVENPSVRFDVSGKGAVLTPEALRPLWHIVPRATSSRVPFEDQLSSPQGLSSTHLVRNVFATGPVEPLRLRVRCTNGDTNSQRLRLRLQSPSEDVPIWVRWVSTDYVFDEYEGGEWGSGREGSTQDGWFLLNLPPGIAREVTLEIDESLLEGKHLGFYDLRLTIECSSTKGTITESRDVQVELRHPEAAFLDMLPSIYRSSLPLRSDVEDSSRAAPGFLPEDSPFFERYLRSFQDIWDPFQALIDRLDTLFGAFSTPPAYLLWLGAWVFAPNEEDWPEMKRRQIVAEAVELFRWRGTRRGLSRFLQLYTGVVPRIDDLPVTGMVLSPTTLLGNSQKLGSIPAHVFTVTIQNVSGADWSELAIRRIIEFEKPAHTSYILNISNRLSP